MIKANKNGAEIKVVCGVWYLKFDYDFGKSVSNSPNSNQNPHSDIYIGETCIKG